MSAERSEAFRAPVGMHDVLPPDSRDWRDLVAAFAVRAERFGYELAITPIVEHREVFERLGEATDVVRKEMYDFDDKGGRALALRPEGTAPVVRAYAQHHPTLPWKVWYVAPNFRYERPQKGRYRQHWQVGAEALGPADPQLDVEMISFAHGFVRELGISQVRVLLNSMGDLVDIRAPYVAALRGYFLAHATELGDEFRERVEANPIRVLDAKREDWQDVIERAPQLTEHLSATEQEHFEVVQRGLDAIGIEHELAPRLVRGLDYYTSTTFELTGDALDAAQNALGGGGRYDGLAEEMGAPPTPGIGFALGIERLLIAVGAEGTADPAPTAGVIDAFVVDHLGGLEATVLLHELRESGLRSDRAYGGRSLKAQMKAADRSGARFAVVLAPDEAARAAVAVKDLEAGDQVEVAREQIAGWLRVRLDAGRAEG